MKKFKHFFHLAKIYFNFLSARQSLGYLPAKLWIETASRCNLSCILCPNKDLDKKQKGDMDFDLYKKIIDGSKDFVHEVNLFHRGEPLLHPDIIEMIKYAKKAGLKTRIHTNGVLLNEGLASGIIGSGLDEISFSVDGYTAADYENNRQGASFDKVIKNITGFLEMKKNISSAKPYTIIQVMQYNRKLAGDRLTDQKKEFLKKFEGLPLDRLLTRDPHNWGGNIKEKGSGKDMDSFENEKTSTCTFPWYSLTIFFDGKVYLCPQDFKGEMVIGDLSRENIKDIFNNKKMLSIRKKFKEKDIKSLIPCNSCDRIRRKTFLKIPLNRK